MERGIEGGYSFLSALAGTETCSEMNRALEHFELLQLVDRPAFFVSYVDVPFKVTEHGLRHYENQLTKSCWSRCTRDTARTYPTRPSAAPWRSITRSAA